MSKFLGCERRPNNSFTWKRLFNLQIKYACRRDRSKVEAGAIIKVEHDIPQGNLDRKESVM